MTPKRPFQTSIIDPSNSYETHRLVTGKSHSRFSQSNLFDCFNKLIRRYDGVGIRNDNITSLPITIKTIGASFVHFHQE